MSKESSKSGQRVSFRTQGLKPTFTGLPDTKRSLPISKPQPVRKVSDATLKRRMQKETDAALLMAAAAVDNLTGPAEPTSTDAGTSDSAKESVTNGDVNADDTAERRRLQTMVRTELAGAISGIQLEFQNTLKAVQQQLHNTLGPVPELPSYHPDAPDWDNGDSDGEEDIVCSGDQAKSAATTPSKSVNGSPAGKGVPRIAKLQDWNGKVETFAEWLWDAKLAARNARVRRMDEVAAVAVYIRGDAKSLLARAENPPRTFAELTAWVNREVCTEADRARAYRRIELITWQKSVAATEREFRRSLEVLPSERNSRYVLDAFKRSLPMMIATKVQEDQPSTFERAVRVAIAQEGSLVDLMGDDGEWNQAPVRKGKGEADPVRKLSFNAMDAVEEEQDVLFAMGMSADRSNYRSRQGGNGANGASSGPGFNFTAVFGPGCLFCKAQGHVLKSCELSKRPENAEKLAKLQSIMKTIFDGRKEVLNFNA